MALSNYSDLVTALSAWLDGSPLGGREGDFITLAEDEINSRLANALNSGAQIRPMLSVDPVTIDGEYVDLPDGETVLPISIEISGLDCPWVVNYAAPDRFSRLPRFSDDDPAPRFYTLAGDRMRFKNIPVAPVAGTIFRFVKIPALSEAVTTNWVLASHRNVYLYGALAQAEMFGWNAQDGANWATMFANACEGMIARYPVATDMTPLRSEIADLLDNRSMTYSSFMSGDI